MEESFWNVSVFEIHTRTHIICVSDLSGWFTFLHNLWHNQNKAPHVWTFIATRLHLSFSTNFIAGMTLERALSAQTADTWSIECLLTANVPCLLWAGTCGPLHPGCWTPKGYHLQGSLWTSPFQRHCSPRVYSCNFQLNSQQFGLYWITEDGMPSLAPKRKMLRDLWPQIFHWPARGNRGSWRHTHVDTREGEDEELQGYEQVTMCS